jgi:hypothetical protein
LLGAKTLHAIFDQFYASPCVPKGETGDHEGHGTDHEQRTGADEK